MIKYRHEYKCKISYWDMLALRRRLESVMSRDSHSDNEGVYTIKSLYFDNYFDKALSEKVIGVSRREKFRIRYYGNDLSFIRLEKKSKLNGLCVKQTAPISVQECQGILEGNTDALFEAEEELKKEFYAKMKYQLLRPKNIVAYEREAFVFGLGNVRVTFDTNIRGSSNTKGFLDENNSFVHLYNNVILEIKWDEYLPQFIKDIVQLNNKSISSFSKYAATRFI